MKVIIVEVTRAANTFGRTHLAEIREAYGQIAGIVERAQADGRFRAEIDPPFAALAFYGLIEQVLTGWIFDTGPVAEPELEYAKGLIVDTICRGLSAEHDLCLNPARMTESPLIKRLLWSGLLAATGALATLVGTHVATLIWRHLFDEEPPSD